MKRIIKKILGISEKEGLCFNALVKSWHRRLGPHFYKQKYSAADVVEAMKKVGLKEGSTLLIQSSWGEFYNCTSTPVELIEEILKTIGPTGTLMMPSMPIIKEGQPFDVKNNPTSAGYFAECFRKYPDVKRSINTRHSVCAIGANADYLLSEHHLGETPWDEKSPYYKLSRIDGLVFGMGLGSHWLGTIAHCVDSLLKNELPYYGDLWDKEKTKFEYIDWDGTLKAYYNYGMPTKGKHIRYVGYFKERRLCNKYLDRRYVQISNLQITCWDAKEVVPTLLSLARKGIDGNLLPLKIGYKFES